MEGQKRAAEERQPLDRQLEERREQQKARWAVQKQQEAERPPPAEGQQAHVATAPLPASTAVQAVPNPWRQQPREGRGGYLAVPQSARAAGGTAQVLDLGYTRIDVPEDDLRRRPCRTSCLFMWCPCCLGDPCGERHLRDLRAASSSFIFVVTVVDVVVFLVEVGVAAAAGALRGLLAPAPCVLEELGGVFAPAIVHRWETWRLFTAVVLHGGLFHLVMNMYVQFLVGMRCEARWGSKVTAAVYGVSGLAGTLASASGNPAAVGVGASGAIVGLVAAQFAELMGQWATFEPGYRQRQVGQTLFFLFMLFTFGVSDDHVDNFAHAGGLVAGFLFGLSRWLDPALSAIPVPCTSIAQARTGVAVICALLLISLAVLLFLVVPVPEAPAGYGRC
mmetsp:Transcript_13386/g.38945  ORF Transcript_13386/g.38945 Transcript_13386/m.38945 type:complete len:391 (-) Transcript_13386:309-1481(-)